MSNVIKQQLHLCVWKANLTINLRKRLGGSWDHHSQWICWCDTFEDLCILRQANKCLYSDSLKGCELKICCHLIKGTVAVQPALLGRNFCRRMREYNWRNQRGKKKKVEIPPHGNCDLWTSTKLWISVIKSWTLRRMAIKSNFIKRWEISSNTTPSSSLYGNKLRGKDDSVTWTAFRTAV